MSATTDTAPALPGSSLAHFANVALIDAEKAASIGDMSLSWWHEAVRAGRAPKPVIRKPRCTRYKLCDVLDFWLRFAEEGRADTEAAASVIAKATKASRAARAAAAAQ